MTGPTTASRTAVAAQTVRADTHAAVRTRAHTHTAARTEHRASATPERPRAPSANVTDVYVSPQTAGETSRMSIQSTSRQGGRTIDHARASAAPAAP
ncbi:hypothetical protein RN607_05800 [Demequina capsici]|uniref:Uncharacterized protein n=1 Tax=Demequina capsici TaxID=3075620 RepID=A0AA96FF25_9MICO|nr:hypothetical protein [Demequina sp. PMTSA13]WNM28517.1 hypothetical protein RN607_05800 [Demequina sp. PMTSA13]